MYSTFLPYTGLLCHSGNEFQNAENIENTDNAENIVVR